jgi:hypothetical protein
MQGTRVAGGIVTNVVQVRIRVERQADGSYSAWDTSSQLVAEGEDFTELRNNLDEVIRIAHGVGARPVLVVGRQMVQFPPTPPEATTSLLGGTTKT